jgi:hypothetical protein
MLEPRADKGHTFSNLCEEYCWLLPTDILLISCEYSFVSHVKQHCGHTWCFVTCQSNYSYRPSSHFQYFQSSIHTMWTDCFLWTD